MSLVKMTQDEAVACVHRMREAACELDWTDRDTYAAWLSQTYFYVRHATRVLATAAGRCSLDDEKLHLKLLDGITEEKGHEILAIRDLKAIGSHIDRFSEWPETSAYYQSLYANISADGPFSLVGYFVPLEGLAAIGLADVLKTVTKTYGDEGTSFLRMHCIVDEGHFKEGLDFLALLNDEQLKLVRKHLQLSTALYIGILKRTKAFREESRRRAA